MKKKWKIERNFVFLKYKYVKSFINIFLIKRLFYLYECKQNDWHLRALHVRLCCQRNRNIKFPELLHNHGSKLIRCLNKFCWFSWIFGKISFSLFRVMWSQQRIHKRQSNISIDQVVRLINPYGDTNVKWIEQLSFEQINPL